MKLINSLFSIAIVSTALNLVPVSPVSLFTPLSTVQAQNTLKDKNEDENPKVKGPVKLTFKCSPKSPPVTGCDGRRSIA